jgi:hypothetical protein
MEGFRRQAREKVNSRTCDSRKLLTRFLDRAHSWLDDGLETFFIHRTLDRNMWERSDLQAWWWDCGEEFTVFSEMLYWTDDLSNSSNNDRREELPSQCQLILYFCGGKRALPES